MHPINRKSGIRPKARISRPKGRIRPKARIRPKRLGERTIKLESRTSIDEVKSKPLDIIDDVVDIVDKPVDEGKKIEFIDMEHEYKYRINECVKTNYADITTIEGKTKIHICIYRINNSGKIPFLQYLLNKYPHSKKPSSELLTFPFRIYNSKKGSVLDIANKYVKNIVKKTLESDGYLVYRKNIYVFYNIGNIVNIIGEKKRKDTWWWGLITEIINFKKIMNFNIYFNVFNIFLHNPLLIRLYTLDDKIIETPMVGFHGTNKFNVSLIKSYGLLPSSVNGMFGPYYYFGTFRKAVRYAGWNSSYTLQLRDGKPITNSVGRYNDNGSIIRFAIFLGKMRVFLNHPNDDDDMTDIVIEKMKDKKNEKWHKAVLKLHDHNGNWTTQYDSAYLGRVTLNNGGRILSNPEYILKNFDQQMVLTTQILDVTTLEKNWKSQSEKYQIL